MPQTNPTTRDRLPFSVKRKMLAVVHHRRQHLAGRRLSSVWYALYIAYCPMPYLSNQQQRWVHRCCCCAESILYGQVWILSGTVATGATYIDATTVALCVGSLDRDMTNKASRHGGRCDKVWCLYHPGRSAMDSVGGVGSPNLDGLGCGKRQEETARPNTVCVSGRRESERAGCQN